MKHSSTKAEQDAFHAVPPMSASVPDGRRRTFSTLKNKKAGHMGYATGPCPASLYAICGNKANIMSGRPVETKRGAAALYCLSRPQAPVNKYCCHAR